MNTKEAIDILEKKNISGDELLKMKIKNVKRLAKLLQRGEKFEAMWKEMKKDAYGGEDWWNRCDGIMRYEQKYFPKKEVIR